MRLIRARSGSSIRRTGAGGSIGRRGSRLGPLDDPDFGETREPSWCSGGMISVGGEDGQGQKQLEWFGYDLVTGRRLAV